jgi:hypothetical protein
VPHVACALGRRAGAQAGRRIDGTKNLLDLQKRAGNAAMSGVVSEAVSASAPSYGAAGGVIQRQCSSCATGKHKCAKCQEEDDEVAQHAPSRLLKKAC